MADVTGQVTNAQISKLPVGQRDTGALPFLFQPGNQIPFAGVAAGSDAAVINLIVTGLIAAAVMKAS